MDSVAKALELLTTKTEMVLFKGSFDRERPIVIKINEKSVALKRTIWYLGVHLDVGLGISSHVDYLSIKIIRSFYALARLMESNWGFGHRAMRTMYADLFVPITACAATGWADLLGSVTETILARAPERVLLGIRENCGS